ncbi:MAG: peptide deformylase [Clostridia bacterium]|nr:peptide deformylase [Clostridia bacterium]MBQ9252165.1 peptide deformylase [Clostridia bacterium]
MTLSYLDQIFQPHVNTFREFTAQIIQHGIDHCEGVPI